MLHEPKTHAVAFLALLLSASPLSAAEIQVKPGDDLRAVLEKALPCDHVVLPAGQTIAVGELVTPVRPQGACPITIRTSATLPTGRLAESNLPLLATISTNANVPAVQVVTPGWVFVGIRFHSPTQSETIVVHEGHRATFDRIYAKGNPAGTKRGIRANADDITVRDSLLLDYKAVGADSQAIEQWEGCGLKVLNNTLEGAGENIMFGGADSRTEALMPCNALVEGNLLRKPLQWEHESQWVIKNHAEVKAGRNITFRNNIHENSWRRAQMFSLVVTPANQEATAPWSQTENILYENITTINIFGCIQVSGWGYTSPTRQTKNVTFRNIVCDLRGGEMFQIGQEVLDLTLDHITSTSVGAQRLWMGQLIAEGTVKNQDGTDRVPAYAVKGFTFSNILAACDGGGVRSSQGSGSAALAAYAQDVTWKQVVLGGCDAGATYPAGTFLPTLASFLAQLQPDGTLVAGSVYTGAGTDGKNLGYLGVGSSPLPPPPPVDPPPALSVTLKSLVIVTCRPTVTAVPPDTTGGWKVQFRRGSTNFGTADATAPYERTSTVPTGTHLISGVWTKSGRPSQAAVAAKVECQ